MKTLFTLLVAGLFTFAATAQDKMGTTKDQKAPMEKKMVTEKKYWCTHCDYSSATPGSCPTHKTATVKEGMYFCPGAEAHATAEAGKCNDGTAMMKMDESLVKKNKMMGEKMENEKAPAKK